MGVARSPGALVVAHENCAWCPLALAARQHAWSNVFLAWHLLPALPQMPRLRATRRIKRLRVKRTIYSEG
jgi:hypothetical protein